MVHAGRPRAREVAKISISSSSGNRKRKTLDFAWDFEISESPTFLSLPCDQLPPKSVKPPNPSPAVLLHDDFDKYSNICAEKAMFIKTITHGYLHMCVSKHVYLHQVNFI